MANSDTTSALKPITKAGAQYNRQNSRPFGMIIVSFFKYAILIFFAVAILFPIVMVVLSSFKTDLEYVNTTAFQLPENFLNFKNYIRFYEASKFFPSLFNSCILVFFSVSLNVLLGTMTAYCLDRFNFPLKKPLRFLYMLSAIVPGVTLQLSIYKLFKEIHIQSWGGQFAAPVLIYAATDIVQIWIYLQFMEKIPVSLDESVKMDGGSYFRIFRSIVFPLLGPATATVIIIKAVGVYNDMFIQYLYMSSGKRSISTMLSTFGGRAGSRIVQNAGLVLAMIPTVVLFIIMQKYIFAGITAGSVKE